MKIKRKVVCVFGTFDKDSDFVLEPATELDKENEVFEIEGEEQ
jgi:hypothetical protein